MIPVRSTNDLDWCAGAFPAGPVVHAYAIFSLCNKDEDRILAGMPFDVQPKTVEVAIDSIEYNH